ncbi:hypothetical protein SVA_1240 [Sulfurifustis variabilis]|uniref:Putative DNA-binding domain-containing protein n=1 Tax=Sulfurifustis variabilis TaxID=1675686 RepID=A0A1B4V387_9GAMM|nr:DNA-binding domain-containing protein [Sulfurifustis variabilis]BAU47815.1 hypothetical protein SVA_1240 [Sulfurifustis variabilis]
MPSLHELQSRFAAALLGDPADVLPHVQAHRFPPERLLQVYRNNVTATLVDALGDIYPVVRRLVGPDFFGFAARAYLRANLPTGGNLHDYGDRFAGFLCLFEPARDLDYLGDVARLDWARHRAFHAADADALPLDALARVEPSRYPALRFTLHPSVSLVASPYPLLRIWEVNQPDQSGDQEVDLAEGGVSLLVIRRGLAVEIESLDRGEFALLTSLAKGLTLERAAVKALAATPDLRLDRVLRRHVAGQTIVDFTIKD